MGTSLALARYLRSTGKEVTCLLPDAPDEALDWMPGVKDMVLFDADPGKAQEALHRADVLFALDYNGMGRLGPMADAARRHGHLAHGGPPHGARRLPHRQGAQTPLQLHR